MRPSLSRFTTTIAVGLLVAACASATSLAPIKPPPASELTHTQPPANSASPASGSLASLPVAPTQSASPTPVIVSRHWPYETTGELRDVLFSPDGRVIVVEGDFRAQTSRVVALTADGAVVAGWPWVPPPTGDWIAQAALGPDGSVYVAVRGAQGIPVAFTWMLHRLDLAGAELPGFPVDLPPVPFCSLRVSDGVAYAVCQIVAEGTGAPLSSVVTAILPDGSTAAGWPAEVAGAAGLIGFAPGGAVFMGSGDERSASITAFDRNGATLPGWPQATRWLNGDAGVDRQGRVWYSSYDWTEGQCGPAARTVYATLNSDGKVPSGWPVSVTGWASGPAFAPDGVMYVAQEGGLANAYAPTGSVLPGWPAKNVDVAVGCYAGSRPFSAGNDGVVILGHHQVTLIQRDGALMPGWPVELPYQAAMNCPTCTPGPGAPVDPAVGELGVWVAAYDGDFYRDQPRPRLIGIDRTGSLPPDWQQAFGRAGDEILWLRVAPAGGVWAAVAFDLGGDQGRSALYRLADDRPASK